MHTPNEPPQPDRPDGPGSFSTDDALPTQPAGSLVPPPRKPPTALGANADSSFPLDPRRFIEAWRKPGWRGRSRVERLASELLDAIDGAADRIAEGLRLRQ